MPGETNPVEQRIAALADKWKQAAEINHVRIVRICGKEDEADMMDAFMWYMLGLDTPVDDIAFILDPVFSDTETYSDLLMDSLDEIIREWNESEKTKGINFIPVEWKADRSLRDKKNYASVFVRNFNRLASVLGLEEGRFTVATLPVPHAGKEKEIQEWMTFALEEGIASNVRFLVFDWKEKPLYEHLAAKYSKEIFSIFHDFDMSNILNQVAAMGDPTDPSTTYRISFVRMLDAMKKNKEKEAIKEGGNCIRMASENQASDPNWLIQIVVVNVALTQDQLKYRNYEKALKRANAAVKAATPLPEIMEGGLGQSVLGEALMTRASAHCFFGKWSHAIEDFSVAGDLYKGAHNPVMAIEAYRMAGFCCKKSGEEAALDYCLKGFRLATTVDAEVLKNSTFPLLTVQLLDRNYQREISYEEIDRFMNSVYGRDWAEIIKKIAGKPVGEATYG